MNNAKPAGEHYDFEPFKRTPEGRIICPACEQTNGSLYNGKCAKCILRLAGTDNSTSPDARKAQEGAE